MLRPAFKRGPNMPIRIVGSSQQSMIRPAQIFRRTSHWTALFLLTLGSPALAVEVERPKAVRKLVLVGGGDHPRQATEKFLQWADGDPIEKKPMKVAIIVWQTSLPAQSFQSYRDEYIPVLKEMGKKEEDYKIYASPTRAEMLTAIAAGKAQEVEKNFRLQLKDTTAVFFSGGDQAEGVKVLKAYPGIAKALREMYEHGVVFGGTSAGTALMSNPMLMGDDFDPNKFTLEDGFGLLPPEILVDQHFLKRKRKHRLGAMMLKGHIPTGVGVEEDGAIAIENNRYLTVLGDKVATVLNNHLDTSLEAMDEIRLTAGQQYDLRTHRRSGLPQPGETASAARPVQAPMPNSTPDTHSYR